MYIYKKILKYVLLFFMMFPVSVGAEDILIGNDKISTPLPNGYCHLNNSNQSDSRLIKYLEDANQNINQINLVFADCEQLRLWRKGESATLNDYGYVLAPLGLVNKKLNMSRKEYLSQMENIFRKQGIKFLNKSTSDIKKVIERHFPAVELNETKSLGIIHQDNNALYFGIIQNIQTEEGKQKTMLGLFAITLVSKKSVNFYLWKEYQGERTIYDLEDLLTSWIRKVHLNN